MPVTGDLNPDLPFCNGMLYPIELLNRHVGICIIQKSELMCFYAKRNLVLTISGVTQYLPHSTRYTFMIVLARFWCWIFMLTFHPTLEKSLSRIPDLHLLIFSEMKKKIDVISFSQSKKKHHYQPPLIVSKQ